MVALDIKEEEEEEKGQGERREKKKDRAMDISVVLKKPKSPDDMMDLGNHGEGGPAEEGTGSKSEGNYDADDEDETIGKSANIDVAEGQGSESTVKTEHMDEHGMDIETDEERRGRKRKSDIRNNSDDDEDTDPKSRKMRKVNSEDKDMDIADDVSKIVLPPHDRLAILWLPQKLGLKNNPTELEDDLSKPDSDTYFVARNSRSINAHTRTSTVVYSQRNGANAVCGKQCGIWKMSSWTGYVSDLQIDKKSCANANPSTEG